MSARQFGIFATFSPGVQEFPYFPPVARPVFRVVLVTGVAIFPADPDFSRIPECEQRHRSRTAAPIPVRTAHGVRHAFTGDCV